MPLQNKHNFSSVVDFYEQSSAKPILTPISRRSWRSQNPYLKNQQSKKLSPCRWNMRRLIGTITSKWFAQVYFYRLLAATTTLNFLRLFESYKCNAGSRPTNMPLKLQLAVPRWHCKLNVSSYYKVSIPKLDNLLNITRHVVTDSAQ